MKANIAFSALALATFVSFSAPAFAQSEAGIEAGSEAGLEAGSSMFGGGWGGSRYVAPSPYQWGNNTWGQQQTQYYLFGNPYGEPAPSPNGSSIVPESGSIDTSGAYGVTPTPYVQIHNYGRHRRR